MNWKKRSKKVWKSCCGMIINKWDREYYLYKNQEDYDKGNLILASGRLSEAKKAAKDYRSE